MIAKYNNGKTNAKRTMNEIHNGKSESRLDGPRSCSVSSHLDREMAVKFLVSV